MPPPNLDIVIVKVTMRHLAEHSTVGDAESLLRSMRETVTYLERRIAREKIDVVKAQRSGVISVPLTT